MALRLPPLSTLRLFEAAGRLQSFKLASVELAVTPSAISKGVQSLEEWLGVPLFVRGTKRLTLTEAGEAYLPSIRQALGILAAASERVPGRPARRSLALSVAPAFGSRLLLPRLAGFRRLHTDISIAIDTNHRQVDFPNDGVDLAIRMGTGNWPNLEATRLLSEELVPVCSPDFLKSLGKIADLGARLRAAPLIHLTSTSDDWAAWLRDSGLGIVDAKRSLMVDTIDMAIDAACRGLGIAIGRLPFARPELDAGKLVTFCDPVVVAKTGYWLVGLPDTMKRPEVVAFRRWLLSEFRPLDPQRTSD
ncbi:LysR substrate-binding domain-containing protein [Reyranella sp.]|uniref:LysR substrate-binding domain-containing protein n=1 Tax=Reyranella sp. TaxID=1929291 RepID=UPI0012255993|nr:LysR substrate-binding domain-containing protein [Reyranella sp.]TAJ83182.1 MAG: LysR family transcriptional regulator [Reyranella sp.]